MAVPQALLVLLVGIGFLTPIWAAEARFHNPIIFTRTDHDDTDRVVAASRLWVMEEDGSGLRPVPHGDTQADHPSFYSDQRTVLFAEHSGRGSEGSRVSRLVKVDIYSGKREVLKEVAGRCNLNHPALSTKGDLISYQIDCQKPFEHAQWVGIGDGAYEIQTVAHNAVALPGGSIFMHQKDYATVGTNQFNPSRKVSIALLTGHGAGARMLFLTDDRNLNRRPAVSPDGEWFAWQTNAAGGQDEIFMARMNGAERRNLTDAPGNDGHPWFSRDGKWIVFESDRSGSWEIWKVHVETRRAIQLTSGGKKYTSTRPRM